MKYEIRTPRAYTRRQMVRIFLRWLCYALVLLLLYGFMSAGIFDGCQPPLLIPLALAVAMFEKEFSGSIFGVCAGLLLDLALNGIFGFSSVWLMPACLGAALLVTNLIRVNFVNHLWISAVTLIVMLSMEFLFKYRIWGQPHSDIVFMNHLLPAYSIALLLSPFMYFLVKLLRGLFIPKEKLEISEATEENTGEETK